MQQYSTPIADRMDFSGGTRSIYGTYTSHVSNYLSACQLACRYNVHNTQIFIAHKRDPVKRLQFLDTLTRCSMKPWTFQDPALLETEPLTFFNNRKSRAPINMYDSCFNQPEGWDQRKPRCDRRLVSHVHPEIYIEVRASDSLEGKGESDINSTYDYGGASYLSAWTVHRRSDRPARLIYSC